jgi:flagellar basal-body rod protein FlgC
MSASAFDIAASGMAAHRAEMDVIAANIANAETSRASGNAPYRARHAVFETSDASPFAAALNDATSTLALASDDGFEIDSADDPPPGVRFAGTVESASAPSYRYDPGNPLAFPSGPQRGFVAESDVDPIEQMVSLVSAGRAYDADVAALQAAKQMDVEAVDVDRQ